MRLLDLLLQGYNWAWQRYQTSPSSTISRQTSRQILGQHAEQRAAEHLLNHGLMIISRNARAGNGEVDLIAMEGELPIFVEVRYRSRHSWVKAGASIHSAKRKVFIRTARQIMRERGWLQARMDAVLCDEGQPLEWIKNAF